MVTVLLVSDSSYLHPILYLSNDKAVTLFSIIAFISFPFSLNYRNFRHLAAILFNRSFSDKIRLFSIRGETKRVSHCRLRNSEPFRKHWYYSSRVQNSLSIHLFFVYNYYICYLLFRFRFESGLVIDYDANISHL